MIVSYQQNSYGVLSISRLKVVTTSENNVTEAITTFLHAKHLNCLTQSREVSYINNLVSENFLPISFFMVRFFRSFFVLMSKKYLKFQSFLSELNAPPLYSKVQSVFLLWMSLLLYCMYVNISAAFIVGGILLMNQGNFKLW